MLKGHAGVDKRKAGSEESRQVATVDATINGDVFRGQAARKTRDKRESAGGAVFCATLGIYGTASTAK